MLKPHPQPDLLVAGSHPAGYLAAALLRHRDLAPDRAALARAGILPHWKTPEGGLRTRPDDWPERGGLDGFYIAALRRS
jgi:16S rRNA (cytosine967-C5)-methyltransferase